MGRKKTEFKLLKKLEKAVDGWLYKTTDHMGDDPVKMAAYQIQMDRTLLKLKKLRSSR